MGNPVAVLLGQLAIDVDRLVVAGALAARGDGALTRGKVALAGLGQNVPALATTAQLIEDLQHGPIEHAGAALLQLNVAVQQLRASQLQPAATGELAALHTDGATAYASISVANLYALVEALASKKKLSSASELALRDPRFARDPRTWSLIVASFSHTYLRPHAAAAAIGVGAPILPMLETGLRIKKGKDADAEKLRAIVGIRGRAAATLVRECLATGSSEMQSMAFRLLAEHEPAEAEAIALSAVGDGAAPADEYTTVSRLVIVASDATFDRLLDLGKTRSGWVSGCIQSDLADASLDRLLRRLRVRLRADGDRLSFASCDALIWALTRRHVNEGKASAEAYLIDDLMNHPDPNVRTSAMTVLTHHPGAAAKRAIIEVGLRDPSGFGVAIDTLFELGEDIAYETLRPYFPAASSSLAPHATGASRTMFGKIAALFGRHTAVAAHPARGHLDPRFIRAITNLSPTSHRGWLEPMLDAMEIDPKSALDGLGRLGDPRAIPTVLPLLDAPWTDATRHAIHALGQLRASDAGPAIARWITAPEASGMTLFIVMALIEARAVNAIPILEKALNRLSPEQQKHVVLGVSELRSLAENPS